jgi:hypothetical protein
MVLSDFEVRAELERVQAELARERKRCAALERQLAAGQSQAPARAALVLVLGWMRARWKILVAVGAGLAFAWLTAWGLAASGRKPTLVPVDARQLSGMPLAPVRLPTPIP